MTPSVCGRTVLLGLVIAASGCRRANAPASTVASAASPSTTQTTADPLHDIDARIQRVMDAYEVPGLSIAIVHGGQIAHARGYGVLQRGKDAEVDENTVFAIASNTKAFVATALAMLADEGKLGLDDRVVDRLPKFETWDPCTTKELRVRDLVSHRSGLDTWAGDLMWIGSTIDTDTLLGRLPHLPAGSSLRTKYGYSNLMFVVAGEVIETVAKKPWDAVVRQRLLEPIGMRRTVTSVDALAGLDNLATPHAKVDDGSVIVPYLDLDAAGAAGAMSSSAADMARWLLVQLGDGHLDGRSIVPARVVAQLRVPHTPIPLRASDPLAEYRHFTAYGLGWFLHDYRGRLVVTHGGGLPGMTSRVAMVPEADVGVVVLTNSESPASSVIAYDVLDAYLGGPPLDHLAIALQQASEQPPPADAGASATVEVDARRYVGTYRNALLGRAEVSRGDDGIVLRLVDHGGLDCPLQPTAEAVFGCAWSNPIFGRSTVAFDVGDRRAARLRFRVRPEFIDPLEYVFDRR